VNRRFDVPNLGVGIGLRTVHYRHVVDERPAIDWFEILSDNYMHTAGRPLEWLDAIASSYRVAMHGVSLNIGSSDPIDRGYVKKLRALRDRVRAAWVSDHLCWTGVGGRNTHDLLPLPYTEETLRHTIARVREVEDLLGGPIALENPSTYLEYEASTMRECDFLRALAEEADCAILLDVNNVYVSATNHGTDPRAYLDAMPWDRVVQFHVAGHTDCGTHLLDTHDGRVIEPVWELLGEAYARAGGASVLLEWDARIPPFAEVHAEALLAKDAIEKRMRVAS